MKRDLFGIKVISILFHITAILTILFSFFSGFIETRQYMEKTTFHGFGPPPRTLWQKTFDFVYQFVLPFAFGIFQLFVARSLWKLRNWARISAIMISLLVAIIIISIGTVEYIKGWRTLNVSIQIEWHQFLPLLAIVILHIIIASYLLSNTRVKNAFKVSKS